ncbi:hypothetical protein [Nocardioides sp.]|uniref:hypothetical protein n=1 Tax=Nocardioides sp. TaxID=35761 RepID=UPI00378343C9
MIDTSTLMPFAIAVLALAAVTAVLGLVGLVQVVAELGRRRDRRASVHALPVVGRTAPASRAA